MTQLQKIVAKAKILKKSHPNIKWTDLIKKASKLVTPGSKKAVGAKKKVAKKVVAKKKPVAKKKAVGYKDDRIEQLRKATPYIRKYKEMKYSRKDAIKNAMLDAGYMSGTKTHKDTKSHNVRISVMSGLNKTTLSKIDWYLNHIALNEQMIEKLKNIITNTKSKELKVESKKTIINLKSINADYKKMITTLKKHIK